MPPQCDRYPRGDPGHCRAALAYFKIPYYIRFIDAFPMTVTGKVQKFKLREQAIHELGLEELAEIDTGWGGHEHNER